MTTMPMGEAPAGGGPRRPPRARHASVVEETMDAALEPALGSDEDRSASHVQSLGRGLAVIRAFGAGQPEMTLSDVARQAGLSRATARRFLHTLVDLGYVRTDGRRFALRPRVLDLGFAYISSLTLPALARPHLRRLTTRVDESASLSVLDGCEVVYVERVPVSRIMTVAISVGTRFPAHATSMGRVLLAHADPVWLERYLARGDRTRFTEHTITDGDALAGELARARSDGHALVDQELELGLRSIAVGVHDAAGEVVAAMNVSAPVARGDSRAIRTALLPALHEAARALEADLTGSAPRPARGR